jgi:hypothetical protein
MKTLAELHTEIIRHGLADVITGDGRNILNIDFDGQVPEGFAYCFIEDSSEWESIEIESILIEY